MRISIFINGNILTIILFLWLKVCGVRAHISQQNFNNKPFIDNLINEYIPHKQDLSSFKYITLKI